MLKCGDGNSDGHNPDRVRVGLVENSPEALDGLGDGEGGVLGEDLVIFTDHVVGDLEAELKSRSKSDFFSNYNWKQKGREYFSVALQTRVIILGLKPANSVKKCIPILLSPIDGKAKTSFSLFYLEILEHSILS